MGRHRGEMKDPRTRKELADIKAMEQASKYYQPRIISLEEIKKERKK